MTTATRDGAPAEIAADMSPANPSVVYLLGRLAVMEARVRAAVTARRRTDPEPDDAFRGLYLADEHVDRLLNDAVLRRLPPPPAEIDMLRSAVERQAIGTVPRLIALAAAFGLAPVDVDLLLAALAPDVDPRFEKLFGYLHDDVTRRRASVGLALELTGANPVDGTARARLDPSAPLRRGGLLLVEEPNRPYLTRSLRVPDRVLAHLLGTDEPDPALAPLLRDPTPLNAPEGDRLVRALDAGVRVVHCRQPPGSWTASTVVGGLAAVGRAALVVELPAEPVADIAELVRAAVREARLLRRVLVLGPVEQLGRTVVRELASSETDVVLHGTAPWDPEWADVGVLGLDLHELSSRLVPQVWVEALAQRPTDRAQELANDLGAFRLAPDQARRAVAAARCAAAADDTVLTAGHLAAGARMQNGAGLGRLARRIEPSVTWDDLVLPPLSLAGLQHLTDRVRFRDRVLGDWRLRRAGGRGEGVTALFAGEPGTGKTLAAEVVAADLGLDLYVIDLSSVVDKYIGETEKNLERVFAGAEGVNGVLFFDEADALFGKRSEVSDARDRYANLEVAYLLQRMESFDGLAVLATNLGSNLDEAFARRLSLVVEFARPSAVERRALWTRCLAGVPLASDVDLDFCAVAFELAGGDIRNIAVTVAYVAAADCGVADMAKLMRAVESEYRKLGRLCVEAEFGPYYPLISGVGSSRHG